MNHSAATLLSLLFLAGCGNPLADLDDASGDASPAEEARFTKVAEAFGTALFKEDYAAAYDLCSQRLRGTMSLEKFTKAHQDARREYAADGPPLQVESGISMTGAELREEADDWGLPPEIPAGDRLGWGSATFALEISDGEVDRCYDCYVLIVNDAGQDRIGHFEYAWCD